MLATVVAIAAALCAFPAMVAAQPIPGVHVPLPIDPTVQIGNAVWMTEFYYLVLRRAPDAAGYRTNFMALENGMTREALFSGIVAGPEFQSNKALADRAGFIVTLFKVLLQRAPSQQEINNYLANLKNADGTGSGDTWVQTMDSFYYSDEYKSKNCQTGYYTLGAQVNGMHSGM